MTRVAFIVFALAFVACARRGIYDGPVGIERQREPRRNPVADYLDGAECQAETDAQRATVRAALDDLATQSPAALAARRYPDYQGRAHSWDVRTVLMKHLVPSSPRSLPTGADFYRDATAPAVRRLATALCR